jgi:hypothetical protein
VSVFLKLPVIADLGRMGNTASLQYTRPNYRARKHNSNQNVLSHPSNKCTISLVLS